ncbi:MAG: TIGR01212 family radical SAM protein [Bacteroidales bacterium]|nr:TIGR01212 family radical SAM protein [Bacteroidales bacterium]MCP5515577.1 TIGR01212 family radical SAM protein [Spirochaetales bacterium]
MDNNFPWGHQRRFNSYTEYFRQHFGERVQKLAIDAGFTCPNRDNTVGKGGCTYCNNDAFNPSYCQPGKTVSRQIQEGIEFHKQRYKRVNQYLAYFQAYSNTYAPLKNLVKLYEEALSFPEVIGLVIGTRPDCVNEEILDYLGELGKKVYLVVEYGIESCYDKTLKRINRGHDFAKTVWALEESAKRSILTGGHLILGLPGESRDEILKEADILSRLPLHSVKFHQLQIIKGTLMAKEFMQHPENFHLYGLDEYLELVCEIVERLNPAFVVERIAGEVSPSLNLNTSWGIRYDGILRLFEKMLEDRQSFQGKYYRSTL